MPKLKLDNSIIKRKFLGVMLDENMSWKDHIKTTEKKKLTKNIDLLYRAKPYLDVTSLKSIYFYFFIFKLCKHCLRKYLHTKIKNITL